MSRQPASCPASREQVVSQYFLEHRAKVIDIAAFLDRLRPRTTARATTIRVVALKAAGRSRSWAKDETGRAAPGA